LICESCGKHGSENILNLIKHLPDKKKKRRIWRICNKCFKKVKKELGLK
jgi:hypothetical protein